VSIASTELEKSEASELLARLQTMRKKVEAAMERVKTNVARDLEPNRKTLRELDELAPIWRRAPLRSDEEKAFALAKLNILNEKLAALLAEPKAPGATVKGK
jgi:NRPS condensation-like uncharacterized protein